MRLDKACLSACIKPGGASAIAALHSLKSLNRQGVFEKMSRKVTACLYLGLFCSRVCVCARTLLRNSTCGLAPLEDESLQRHIFVFFLFGANLAEQIFAKPVPDVRPFGIFPSFSSSFLLFSPRTFSDQKDFVQPLRKEKKETHTHTNTLRK